MYYKLYKTQIKLTIKFLYVNIVLQPYTGTFTQESVNMLRVLDYYYSVVEVPTWI